MKPIIEADCAKSSIDTLIAADAEPHGSSTVLGLSAKRGTEPLYWVPSTRPTCAPNFSHKICYLTVISRFNNFVRRLRPTGMRAAEGCYQ